jgi:hypothetical protein
VDQVPQVGHGAVGAEHLKDEEVNHLDRTEQALPPVMPRLMTGREDRLLRQERP